MFRLLFAALLAGALTITSGIAAEPMFHDFHDGKGPVVGFTLASGFIAGVALATWVTKAARVTGFVAALAFAALVSAIEAIADCCVRKDK